MRFITKRDALVSRNVRSIDENPITTLLGPRQCGKTTLARTFLQRDIFQFGFRLNPETLVSGGHYLPSKSNVDSSIPRLYHHLSA